MLGFGEEALDQIEFLVEVLVIASPGFAVSLWRNDNLAPFFGDLRLELIRVIAPIVDQSLGFDPIDEFFWQCNLVSLTLADNQPDRIAKSIARPVVLGRQAAAGSAETLSLNFPFIFVVTAAG